MKPKKPTGFSTMTQEQRREIASLGGKAAWAKGRAHRFTRAEALKAVRERWKDFDLKPRKRETKITAADVLDVLDVKAALQPTVKAEVKGPVNVSPLGQRLSRVEAMRRIRARREHGIGLDEE